MAEHARFGDGLRRHAGRGVGATPAAGDAGELDAPDRFGQVRVADGLYGQRELRFDQALRTEFSSPSIVRMNTNGAHVAHACGLDAVGYSTGKLVRPRR